MRFTSYFIAVTAVLSASTLAAPVANPGTAIEARQDRGDHPKFVDDKVKRQDHGDHAASVSEGELDATKLAFFKGVDDAADSAEFTADDKVKRQDRGDHAVFVSDEKREETQLGFFKGINDAGNGNGLLSAVVTDGAKFAGDDKVKRQDRGDHPKFVDDKAKRQDHGDHAALVATRSAFKGINGGFSVNDALSAVVTGDKVKRQDRGDHPKFVDDSE